MWDLNSGSLIREFSKHTSQITSIKNCPFQAGNVFMSTGIDGNCLIWDKRQPPNTVTVCGEGNNNSNVNSANSKTTNSWILASCWNNAGDRFYCGRRNGFVEEYDPRNCSNVIRKFKPPLDVGSVYQVHCMPNDEELMV